MAINLHTGDSSADFEAQVPLAVKIVAAIFVVHGARLLAVKALPALGAGDPSALSELFGAAMPAMIAMGLLFLHRWAWWLATVACAACWIIPAGVLAMWNEANLAAEFEDPQAMVRLFTIVAIVSFISFLLLVHSSTRRAFTLNVES